MNLIRKALSPLLAVTFIPFFISAHRDRSIGVALILFIAAVSIECFSGPGPHPGWNGAGLGFFMFVFAGLIFASICFFENFFWKYRNPLLALVLILFAAGAALQGFGRLGPHPLRNIWVDALLGISVFVFTCAMLIWSK